jgi:hypothetical protein
MKLKGQHLDEAAVRQVVHLLERLQRDYHHRVWELHRAYTDQLDDDTPEMAATLIEKEAAEQAASVIDRYLGEIRQGEA